METTSDLLYCYFSYNWLLYLQFRWRWEWGDGSWSPSGALCGLSATGCQEECSLRSPSLPSLMPGDPLNQEGNDTLPMAPCILPTCSFSDGSLLCRALCFEATDRGNQFCCCSTGEASQRCSLHFSLITAAPFSVEG